MSDHALPITVEGLLIDEHSNDVLLFRPLDRTLPQVWRGVHDEWNHPVVHEKPLFALVRLTHALVQKFIPPCEWIQMGTATDDRGIMLYYATTWPLPIVDGDALTGLEMIRVPLKELEHQPDLDPYWSQVADRLRWSATWKKGLSSVTE